MFIKKSVGKNQLISRKHGSFRLVFKFVRNTVFERTYDFLFDYIFLYLLDIVKVYDKKIISFRFVSFILLHT